MEKNNKGINWMIEKFAMVSQDLANIYPNGKSVVVFSLNNDDFNNTKTQVNVLSGDINQFKIDISGIEFIFLRDELLNNVEGTPKETR